MFSDAKAGASVWYSLALDGPWRVISPHFVLKEFASKCGQDAVLVHPELLALLERIRAEFLQSVHVRSGYRSPAHNHAVGGVAKSRHLWGLAADITLENTEHDEVATLAESLEAGGVGRYNGFTHVDVWWRNRRWDMRSTDD